MIFDALNIAGSSLKSQQKAMDVLANNISNVNTPGYSRQTPSMASEVPQTIGNNSFGRGVVMNGASRLVDPMIDGALLQNGSQQDMWTSINTGLTSVESAFGSLQSTGLSAALDGFFTSWQQLANNPQDQASRINVLNKSQLLSTQMSGMNTQLVNAQQSADTEIDARIQSANTLLNQIGTLNTQIRKQEGVQGGGALGTANDLRDQRDQAVRDLARLIPVQQIDTGGGGTLIQSLGGDLLVQDGQVRNLARGTAGANGFQSVVIAGTNTPLSGLDQGGRIGGLVALRDNYLGGYRQQLDSIAGNMTFAVNQLHSNGASATRLSQVTSAIGASNTALPVNDPAQSNTFAAQVVSGSFTVHVFDAAGQPLAPNNKITVNVTAGVSTMDSIATDINAAALGVTASVDTAGRLVMNGGANTLSFGGDTSNFLAAYQINNFFQGSTAGDMAVSNDVVANSALIHAGAIDPATSVLQAADNTVALAIMGLNNSAISFDGTTSASLHDRTSGLATTYGSDMATAQQQQTYRTAEAASLNAQRQAISGVNVDQELIDMIKFQRAYEASAKVITTTNSMLDSLLGLIR